MKQSPPWEADSLSASQEITRFLGDEVHYRVHKKQPPVHVLSLLNPINIPNPIYLRIILILLSHLRLSSRVVSFFQDSQQKFCTHSCHHTRCMLHPYLPSWFDYRKKTQHVFFTRIGWLMLFREIIAVYSENHTKPANKLCGKIQSCWSLKCMLQLSLPLGIKRVKTMRNNTECLSIAIKHYYNQPTCSKYKSGFQGLCNWRLFLSESVRKWDGHDDIKLTWWRVLSGFN
jgi:hypothetical protein